MPMTQSRFQLNLRLMSDAESFLEHEKAGADTARPRPAAWRASASALFLPGLVVALGYAGLWAFLTMSGRGEGALARVSLLILVLGVPLLLAHAGLRLSTTRLTLRGALLEAHPGFPARDPVTVSYRAITSVTVRRGLSGWITGAGSLVIARETGAPVIVAGLAKPDAVLADLSARREALNAAIAPS